VERKALNIISVSLFPRYKHTAKHMEPVVVGAMRRVLYDDARIDLTEISAAEYQRIVAPPKGENRAVHDPA
jgi:hypothetical protein